MPMTFAPNAPQPIAIAIVRQGEKYLVGVRPGGTVLAGYSEFPGGKVRPDETPADAAIRECLEETGLLIRVVSQLSVVDHSYSHGAVRLHFFDCICQDLDPVPAEPFRWVGRAELATLQFPQANRGVVESIGSKGVQSA